MDLAGRTFVFHDVLQGGSVYCANTWGSLFTTNSGNTIYRWDTLDFSLLPYVYQNQFSDSDVLDVYDQGIWASETYRTITFVAEPNLICDQDAHAITKAQFETWLLANAMEYEITLTTRNTELNLIANAIREKGKTNAPLVYPSGFISAIKAISTSSDV